MKHLLNQQVRQIGAGAFDLGNGLKAHAMFHFSRNNGPRIYMPNLVTAQGIQYLLNAPFGETSQISTWYLAPFAANATPQSGWTAANFDSNATEFTNYTEAARQELVTASASGGVIGNLASKATFTIGSGGQTEIWGGGLLSSSQKQGTSGVLLSATRLANPKQNLEEGETIEIGFEMSLSDAS